MKSIRLIGVRYRKGKISVSMLRNFREKKKKIERKFESKGKMIYFSCFSPSISMVVGLQILANFKLQLHKEGCEEHV